MAAWPAGSREPEDPDNCYRVDPGENYPEFFLPDLPGLAEAIGRAGGLSISQGPQSITRMKPGLPDNTFMRYRGGACFTMVRN